MRIKGNLSNIPDNSIIGFDAEWTKNYKIKNGNIPFCFSVVVLDAQTLNMNLLEDGDIYFEYIQYYCETPTEFKDLVLIAEEWISKILGVLNTCVLCGHQISSDFSVLYNIGKAYNISSLVCLEKIRSEWKTRKKAEMIHIMDTRYDITKEFLGKSRRLVDMCNDFLLDVTQPELKSSSMTKLQNIFYDKHDDNIYERIAVMNLRHSLCAIVLYWLNEKVVNIDERRAININKSVYNCLNQDFDWINSKDFSVLLDR